MDYTKEINKIVEGINFTNKTLKPTKKYKKVCEYCGKEFETNRENKKYCSTTCRNSYHVEKSQQKAKVEQETVNIAKLAPVNFNNEIVITTKTLAQVETLYPNVAELIKKGIIKFNADGTIDKTSNGFPLTIDFYGEVDDETSSTGKKTIITYTKDGVQTTLPIIDTLNHDVSVEKVRSSNEKIMSLMEKINAK